MGQRVLQARLADRALRTDRLGLGRVGVVLGERVEDLDVDASACGTLAPRGTHGKHFLWKYALRWVHRVRSHNRVGP
jgi:hypothetical protein